MEIVVLGAVVAVLGVAEPPAVVVIPAAVLAVVVMAVGPPAVVANGRIARVGRTLGARHQVVGASASPASSTTVSVAVASGLPLRSPGFPTPPSRTR